MIILTLRKCSYQHSISCDLHVDKCQCFIFLFFFVVLTAVKLFQLSFANHDGIICEIDFQKRKRNGKDAREAVLLAACKITQLGNTTRRCPF